MAGDCNFLTEHYLKPEIRRRGIRLWELKMLLGGYPSEFKLSRVLNCIDTMPAELQSSIAEVLKRWDEASEIIDKPMLDQDRCDNIEGLGGNQVPKTII